MASTLTGSFEDNIRDVEDFEKLLKNFDEYYSLLPDTQKKEINSFIIDKYNEDFENANSLRGESLESSTKTADLSALRRHDLAPQCQPNVYLWNIEESKMEKFIIRRLFNGDKNHFNHFMKKFEPKLKTIRRILCFKKIHEGNEGSVSERAIVQHIFMWFLRSIFIQTIPGLGLSNRNHEIMPANQELLSIELTKKTGENVTFRGYCDLVIQPPVVDTVEPLRQMDTSEGCDNNRIRIEIKTVFEHLFKDTAESAQCDQMLFELLAVVDSWRRNKFVQIKTTTNEESSTTSASLNQDDPTTNTSIHNKAALGILTDMFSLYLANCHIAVEAKASDQDGSLPTMIRSEVEMGITKLPRFVAARSYISFILFLLCGEPRELIGKATFDDEGELLSLSTQSTKLDDCYNPPSESRKRPISDCNNGSSTPSNNASEMDDKDDGKGADIDTLLDFLLNKGPFPGAEGDAIWSKEMEADLKRMFGIIPIL